MADITQEPNGDSNEQPMDAQEEEGPAYERTEQYDKLVEAGINESVAEELDRKLYFTKMLVDGDLDERALGALKEFELEDAKKLIEEFATSKLEHVSNKSAYMCGILEVQKQKNLSSNAKTAETPETQKGPDEAKLNAILERTGYSMELTTGQRKYGGPPPNWGDQPQPGNGHVVFVGRIPRDMFEDELIPLFEEAGTIYELRIMMDPVSKFNRGYGFVTFCEKEAANAAVAKLDGHELSNGRTLKVNISIANTRIFVGSIPKSKTKEEIQEEFSKILEELSDVIIYSSLDDNLKNRGFAFLDFANHKAASTAIRKIMSGKCKVWGNITTSAEWAEPQPEPDAETMAKVKVLYVRNLSSNVTEEMLKTKFEPYGTVEKVKKIKDYAFVHFEKREDAVSAMEDLDNQKLGDLEMNVTLAKPNTANKRREMGRTRGGLRRGGRGGGFDGRGGYGGYGGMGGGYDGYGGPMYRGYGGYNDYYGGYYSRGRGRGMGRGGPGGPMRGFHGGRGMMRGGGMRGGGFRGGRGGPFGGGGGYNGARAGKRKFGGDNQQQAKRRPMDQSWGSQPIAQQPMQDFGGNNQWYQDSFNSSW